MSHFPSSSDYSPTVPINHDHMDFSLQQQNFENMDPNMQQQQPPPVDFANYHFQQQQPLDLQQHQQQHQQQPQQAQQFLADNQNFGGINAFNPIDDPAYYNNQPFNYDPAYHHQQQQQQQQNAGFYGGYNYDQSSPSSQFLGAAAPMTPQMSANDFLQNTPKRDVGGKVSRKRAKQPSTLHLNTSCSNCGTRETKLWRRSEIGAPECNACNLYFRTKGVNRPQHLWRKPTATRRRRPVAPIPFDNNDIFDNSDN